MQEMFCLHLELIKENHEIIDIDVEQQPYFDVILKHTEQYQEVMKKEEYVKFEFQNNPGMSSFPGSESFIAKIKDIIIHGDHEYISYVHFVKDNSGNIVNLLKPRI
jgi:hypothetical protein